MASPSPAHQAPSVFPAELRPPKFCQEQAGKPQWQDVNGYPERDGSRGKGGTQLCSVGSSPIGKTEARGTEPLSLLPADICAFCHKAVGPREPTVEAMRKQYHADCFTCRTCHRLLAGQRYYQKDGRPMCDACYQVPILPRGQPAPSGGGWWEMQSLAGGAGFSRCVSPNPRPRWRNAPSARG